MTETIFWLLLGLTLLCALLSQRSRWAVLGMAAGAGLVLAGLTADVPEQTLLLALLAPCALALLVHRGRGNRP